MLHPLFAQDLAAGRLHRAYLILQPHGTDDVLSEYGRALLGETAFERSPGNVLKLTRGLNDKGRPKLFIDVEEARRVGHFLTQSAYNETLRRAVLIDGAEHLSISAAASLLKIMEEPPTDAHFILRAGNAGRLSLPIRSRCKTLVLRGEPTENRELQTLITAATSAGRRPGAVLPLLKFLSDHDDITSQTLCDAVRSSGAGAELTGRVQALAAEKEQYTLEKTGFLAALAGAFLSC